MKKVVVVGGKGIVGSAIVRIENEAGNEVFISDLDCAPANGKYDIVHICIPYSDRFKEIVLSCLDDYDPKLAIIHSSIPIGTTELITNDTDIEVVHSPVRGVHPHMYEGIKEFVKYIGGDEDSADKCIKHFESIGIEPFYIGTSQTSEALKLLDTSYYGWNIIFAKYAQKVCDMYSLDYDKVYKHPNMTYNLGYTRLGMEHVVRPILNPPVGRIGGTCITPNYKLLPDILLKKAYLELDEEC